MNLFKQVQPDWLDWLHFQAGLKGFDFAPAADTIDMVNWEIPVLQYRVLPLGQDQEDGRMLQTRQGLA